MADHWWRCEVLRQAHWDKWTEEVIGYSYSVHFTSFVVLRTTPKGVWIDEGFGAEKFILGKAVRQFAVPTKELAKQDEMERRKKHVKMCRHRLQIAIEMQNKLEVTDL